ncbi:MAG: hypothetical protein KC468_13240 [Myxococcales bacterium]|nr:hypothetical protein [Myxococcales bacterium]
MDASNAWRAAAALAAALTLAPLAACAPLPAPIQVPPESLASLGLYVAYNNHFPECVEGCDELRAGDIITKIDGRPVRSRHDRALTRLIDGVPSELTVLRRSRSSEQVLEVTFTATPSESLPGVAHAPPLWIVGAEALDLAPLWARRQLYAHASPAIALNHVDGPHVDGRSLVGRPRMLVMCQPTRRGRERECAEAMRVVQIGMERLGRAGVDVLFNLVGYNDTDRRDFQREHGRPELPLVPMYGAPTLVRDPVQVLGVEGSTRYETYIYDSLTIVLLDAGGIVRWHSSGVVPPPEGRGLSATQFTTATAVAFACDALRRA